MMPPDVVWKTQEELSALQDYLKIAQASLEQAAEQGRKRLEKLPKSDEEEDIEYQLAKDEHDYLYIDAFHGEILYPMMERVLAYSIVTMTYTVLETRLTAFAKFIQESRLLELKPSQIAGDPLSRTKHYLKRVADLVLPSAHLWQSLRNLEILRHTIVHNSGWITSDDRCDKALPGMSSLYSKQVGSTKKAGDSAFILVVRLPLCFRFLDEISQFFNQLFDSAGLTTRTYVGEETDLHAEEAKAHAREELDRAILKLKARYAKRIGENL
jgi:hypothetical protein